MSFIALISLFSGCLGLLAFAENQETQATYRWTPVLHTLGPLNIRVLEIFHGYASPCLMDLFTPKSDADVCNNYRSYGISNELQNAVMTEVDGQLANEFKH
jgi:hypothetical protein